jgi:hypothetical protein
VWITAIFPGDGRCDVVGLMWRGTGWSVDGCGETPQLPAISTGGPSFIHRWVRDAMGKNFFIHRVSTTGDTYVPWDEWEQCDIRIS